MAEMQLRNAAKNYGSVRVIDDLNLKVEEGSFTVFVGPSGCGKSTLLRMIAGIEQITEGDLLINNERMNDADPVQRGIAMVFQNYALYPHLSVEKNISFGLKMANLPRAEIKKRAAEAAEILKITPLMKRKPSQLSGGQRQRVAIGRAIVRDPKLFLFDEPLSNLDAELRVAMRIEIAKLHRTLGTTMIYVTHDQTEAMTLADKIVVLRDGKIEQEGSPVELFEDPDNMFVAGFIGSPRMNFLSGKLATSDQVQLDAGGRVEMGPLVSQSSAPNVRVGIRPEHLSLGTSGPCQFEVIVDVIENLGGRYFIYANTKAGEDITFEVRTDEVPKPGAKVLLSLNPTDARIFDESEQRLRIAKSA